MIYEIRNYHFEPTLLEDYKAWARNAAIPFLAKELDLIGFWANSDTPSEVLGEPQDDLGSANLTWILAWPDHATRDETMERVFSSDAWAEIFKDVPGGIESYLRRESKFTESLVA